MSCLLLIGVICLVVGLTTKSNLESDFQSQLEDGIVCIISSVQINDTSKCETDYNVVFLAEDICSDHQLLQRDLFNDSVITFNFTDNYHCKDDQNYEIGDHICYNVDKNCEQSTFQIIEPSMDDTYAQNYIIGGGVMIGMYVACCCYVLLRGKAYGYKEEMIAIMIHE